MRNIFLNKRMQRWGNVIILIFLMLPNIYFTIVNVSTVNETISYLITSLIYISPTKTSWLIVILQLQESWTEVLIIWHTSFITWAIIIASANWFMKVKTLYIMLSEAIRFRIKKFMYWQLGFVCFIYIFVFYLPESLYSVINE